MDRRTTVAILDDALDTSTIPRRKMIVRTAGFGLGAIGVGTLFATVGGLIVNPWAKGDKSPLWVSGWTPNYPGETIYVRRDTGRPEDIVLVRPEDLDAGSMETVFPFREADRGDEEALFKSLRGIRNAVMLIRLRTEDTEKVVKRQGQESFNYGDYFAYSKICTHLGCPTSLYEQQSNRILCPATNRSSTSCSGASRSSVPRLVPFRNCRLQSTRRATWSPTAITSSPSAGLLGASIMSMQDPARAIKRRRWTPAITSPRE